MKFESTSHRNDSIDIFRATRERTVIFPIAGRILQLIKEYSVTANRVGADFNEVIILKVIDALKCGSCEGLSFQSVSNENAKELFLAESLYKEVLEIQQESYQEYRPIPTSEEWHDCLLIVSESCF